MMVLVPALQAQTSLTGAVTGVVTDGSGSVVPGAQVTLIGESNGITRTMNSTPGGRYSFSLLTPGPYRLEVSRQGFKTATRLGFQVVVTETATLDLSLAVGSASETVTVTASEPLVQTESSALGRVVDADEVKSLPLVTRNFTQILGLSTGVTQPVNNAGDLGRGSSSSEGGGLGTKVVNGARPNDNNFQLNGVAANDNLAAGGGTNFGQGDISGGVPVPNPDAIQEFKVQTGQYDAAFGRDAGGNVNIVTKLGTNNFHGTAFEFFRNNALNANDYFRKMLGQPREVLRQNQFGFTLGGPILKQKLLFFTSYQGTRQLNGVAAGCSALYTGPPLTDNRSAAAIGQIFAGKTGLFGGQAVNANGSNVNPIALDILNLKLPNGQYLIPTPQAVNPSLTLNAQGTSSFSSACTFSENQGIANVQYIQNQKSTFAVRYFQASSDQTLSLGLSNVPGAPAPSSDQFRNFALTHTYVLTNNLVNEVVVGYNNIHVSQTAGQTQTNQPLSYAGFGSNVPSDFGTNGLFIAGSANVDPQPAFLVNQPALTVVDSVSYSHGPHQIRFGGELSREYISISQYTLPTTPVFATFTDFVLGLPGGPIANGGNGSNFSNVFETFGGVILFDRKYRKFDGNLYLQDDYKVNSALVLNAGFRYDRLGALSDALGRLSTFNFAAASQNTPASGSLAGFVVSGNYSGGAVPAGVTQTSHNYAIDGNAQNNWSPRVGFALKLTPAGQLVLRGGYGLYVSEAPANGFLQGFVSPPFVYNATTQGTTNPKISLQNPFGPGPFPTLSTLPLFVPYTPSNPVGQLQYQNPNFRSGVTQQQSLNVQADLGHSLLAEVGYVGSHGEHLSRGILPNQALLANASTPIHGVTTTTVKNIAQRVPVLGFTPAALVENNTEGASWFNSLQASLTKRLSNGLQFLAAYTYSKNLDTDAPNVVAADSGVSGGDAIGDETNPHARYGRTNLDRPHRFVVSYSYSFPVLKQGPAFGRSVVNGWQVSGVTIYQVGSAITVTGTNSNNAFGATADFAPLSGKCLPGQFSNLGSIESKLNSYFNTSCFSTNPVSGAAIYPVVGSDGVATGFGNSGVGIVNGPGQKNWDFSLVKRTKFEGPGRFPLEVEFRSEFFNLFNTPQFANPAANIGTSTFGHITSTTVNPRIVQFALKVNY